MARRYIVALIIVGFLLLSIVGVQVHRTYGKVRAWSNQIYEPIQENQVQSVQEEVVAESEVKIHTREPFTIALIGVDRRAGDQGRADTLIVAAVNPQKKSTVVLSIPRDTRTLIRGASHSRLDKINHAYAYGGVPATMDTVEGILGQEIDYYVKVDMEGFKAVIDILGGIRVDNPLAFSYEGHTFGKGEVDLTGDEALAYVRMRYDDPKGDLGRGDRQKAVLRSVIDHFLQIDSVPKLSALFDELAKHIKTNLTFDNWVSLALNYRSATEEIVVEHLAGHGQQIAGIYYYMVPDAEISRIGEILAEQIQN